MFAGSAVDALLMLEQASSGGGYSRGPPSTRTVDPTPDVASLEIDLYITTSVEVLGLVTAAIDIDGEVTTKIEA